MALTLTPLTLTRRLTLIHILQFTSALAYLLCLLYSVLHKGWWLYTAIPLAVGRNLPPFLPLSLSPSFPKPLPNLSPPSANQHNHAVTASVTTTLLLTLHLLSSDLLATRPSLVHATRLLSEFIVLMLWTAVAVAMWLPKGKNFRNLFTRPPYVAWGVGSGVAVGEM